MFNTFYAGGPTVAQQYSSRLQVIFRQQIQPWHPSSTLTHEAGAAVLQLAPEKFWEFSAALFKHQKEFFDVNVVNETRNKTYERLAKIAGSVGVDEQKVLALLVIPETPASPGALNVGNQVTNDIKWMTKVRGASPYSPDPRPRDCLNTELGKSSDWSPCHADRLFQCKIAHPQEELPRH